MASVSRHPCLLLHGFTGGPFEVMPLAAYLQERGFSCRVPQLPGHDPDLETIGDVSWKQWLDAAALEAEKLSADGSWVDVIGFSMGGLISAYLANRFPVRRLVLLSAAAIYISPSRFIQQWMRRDLGWDSKEWHKVRRIPLSATLQFIKLAHYVKRQELKRVAVPAFIAQGMCDPIVHPASARYIYSRLQGEKELFYIPHSRHRVCLEPETELLFGRVEQFLSS